MKNVFDNAKVFGYAAVSGDARVFGYAAVSGDARVSGYAAVSGDARVSGYAVVSDNAEVSGNAVVSGYAEVSGDSVVSTQQGCMFGYFKGRTGIYGLTLTRTKRGNVRFVWGCRSGDDLRKWLKQPGYTDDIKAPVLAFLTAFELANPV